MVGPLARSPSPAGRWQRLSLSPAIKQLTLGSVHQTVQSALLMSSVTISACSNYAQLILRLRPMHSA